MIRRSPWMPTLSLLRVGSPSTTHAQMYVLGVHVRAILDEDDVTRLEGRLHTVVGEAQAVAVRGPKMSQDG